MAKRSKTPLDPLLVEQIRNFLLNEALTHVGDALREKEPAVHEAIQQIKAEQADLSQWSKQRVAQGSRGPQPGKGGRPRKGTSLRVSRTFTLDQQVLDWVESQRGDGESFSEAIERLLKKQMKTLPM